MFIEFGIKNKNSGEVKYVLSRPESSTVDAQKIVEGIIKAGIQDKHSDFFYGKELTDFDFFINDIG